MLKNQKGFAVVEVILAVLLVAAIGAAGYFAYKNHTLKNSSAKSSEASTGSTKQTASSSVSPNQSTASALSASSASSFVQGFYRTYIQASGTSDNSAEELKLVQQDGTSSFVSEYGAANGYDPVLCAQNTVQSFTIGSTQVSSSNSASVSLTRDGYSGNVVVGVEQVDGALKINNITCPPVQ